MRWRVTFGDTFFPFFGIKDAVLLFTRRMSCLTLAQKLLERVDAVSEFLGMDVSNVAAPEKKPPRNKREFDLSKAISTLMRHDCNPDLYDANGRMSMASLLSILSPGKKYTAEEIITLIRKETGTDKRHGWENTDGIDYVYCYQGLEKKYFTPDGPIERDLLYGAALVDALDEPLFHSTKSEAAVGISAGGLRPGNRDVHMWTQSGEKKGRVRRRKTDRIDGGALAGLSMSDSRDVIFKIDMQRAMDNGIKFWKAGNGVVLTDTVIPVEFLTPREMGDDEDIDWDDTFFANV